MAQWTLTNPKPSTLNVCPEVVKPSQYLARYILTYGTSRKAATISPFIRAYG